MKKEKVEHEFSIQTRNVIFFFLLTVYLTKFQQLGKYSAGLYGCS